MATARDRIRTELSDLIDQASEMLKEISNWNANNLLTLAGKYQAWYTKSLPVVRQLLPDRYQEFLEQYRPDKRKSITQSNYSICDFLGGVRIQQYGEDLFEHHTYFLSKLHNQFTILDSAASRLDSILSDIRAVLQAELFDNELEVAQELLKKRHLRASGAVAGVILEGHLKHVAANHILTLKKKLSTLSDFNDAMKDANVIDLPTWRFIQRLGDIRNICVHAKGNDPKSEEVFDLVVGTEKIVKTIF